MHERMLDALSNGCARKAEHNVEAADVRVDDDTDVQVERVAEYYVCRLAADSGQADELSHCMGNLPAVTVDHRARHSKQALCLVAKKSGAPDLLLELRGIGFST